MNEIGFKSRIWNFAWWEYHEVRFVVPPCVSLFWIVLILKRSGGWQFWIEKVTDDNRVVLLEERVFLRRTSIEKNLDIFCPSICSVCLQGMLDYSLEPIMKLYWMKFKFLTLMPLSKALNHNCFAKRWEDSVFCSTNQAPSGWYIPMPTSLQSVKGVTLFQPKE